MRMRWMDADKYGWVDGRIGEWIHRCGWTSDERRGEEAAEAVARKRYNVREIDRRRERERQRKTKKRK